jgi:hypothetical protein
MDLPNGVFNEKAGIGEDQKEDVINKNLISVLKSKPKLTTSEGGNKSSKKKKTTL